MAMNRRGFLQLLGVSAAAAVVVKPSLVVAATEREPEILVTEYALLGPTSSPTGLVDHHGLAGLVLPAPAGRKCRARIIPGSNVANLIANTFAVASYNGPAEVLLSHAECAGFDNLLQPVDAFVFSREFCRVNWGPFGVNRPLELDYEAVGLEDQTFFLGVKFSVGVPSSPPSVTI